MRRFFLILALLTCVFSAETRAETPPATIEDIISDIYRFLAETEEIDYEELQSDMLEIADNPINLNSASYDDLARLRFLSPGQIDNILLYVYHHQMQSLSELRLVSGLQDYEIRDLLPFVCVKPVKNTEPVYWREMFRFARHEITARTDARYVEEPHRNGQLDPVYTQLRYKAGYKDKWQAAFTLRRPTGGNAAALQYGGYVQLGAIKHLRTLVLGNYQVQFGQGLVAASPFHAGRSAYMQHASSLTEGVRKYSSVDGKGLHGIAATVGFNKVDASAWYSLTKDNMQNRRHTVGANLTFRHRNFRAGLTALENIWQDSVRYYYNNAAYNQNYFRGNRQLVGGANFRWHHGPVSLFGEAAFAQNKDMWGAGLLAGMEAAPVEGVDLTLLYRYYSPKFDNSIGYAFSETSRANDENGFYAGADIHLLEHWRFAAYCDMFHFEDVKYGIPYAPSWGYDVKASATWIQGQGMSILWWLRAREKGGTGTYSTRLQLDWHDTSWRLRTEADANLVSDSLRRLTWGVSLFQDVEYSFAAVPLTLQLRVQGFCAPDWNNRIYIYEKDVLYGWSVPAIYGTGGRFFLNMRWQIIEQLSLYLRLSETVYSRQWAEQQQQGGITRTDIHLMLRAVI